MGVTYRQALHSCAAGTTDSFLGIFNHQAVGGDNAVAIPNLSIQSGEGFEENFRLRFPMIYVFSAYDHREMFQQAGSGKDRRDLLPQSPGRDCQWEPRSKGGDQLFDPRENPRL